MATMREQAKNAPKRIEKILVIRHGGLGDFILTLPVLQSLRHAFPWARISVLGSPPVLSLADEYITGIIPSDKTGLHTLYGSECTFPAHIEAEFRDFDLALSYQRDPEAILSRNLGRLAIPWILSGGHPGFENQPVHMIDQLLRPLRQAGLPVAAEIPRIHPAPADRALARKFLAPPESAPEHPGPIVALHPGSGSPKKCWPADNFARIALWLKDTYAATIVVVLGPADQEVRKAVLPQINACSPLLADQLPLTQVAAILERCSLFVGNDSGITHLAAAVDIPTLALFGPTDFRVWGPRSPRAKYLPSMSFCAPCSPAGLADCPDFGCMGSLRVETVQETLSQLLCDFPQRKQK